MNLTEEKLESFVKRDMEMRNRELGWNAFRYRGFALVFDTYRDWWTMIFDFQADPGGEVKKIEYGGFPFTEKIEILKDYLREAYFSEIIEKSRKKGIVDMSKKPRLWGYSKWLRERFMA